MMGERYKNADTVVISDFIAPLPVEEIQQKVRDLKKCSNRFHALSLSKYGNPDLLGMFDHSWAYHPNLVGRLMRKW